MPISEVTNEDNMLMMARYPDGFFDLAIVDPPYGIDAANVLSGPRRKSGNGKGLKSAFAAKDWDNGIPSPEYFIELQRVSKNQIIWGGNYMSALLPNSKGWIIWDKINGTTNFSDCELAYTSFDRASRIFKFMWNGMLQGDMKNKQIRIHPTQKPHQLYTWCLQNYAITGNNILDTHLGSGSSRIAAHDLGFDFYGCELDNEYYEAQESRFKKHISQTKLFAPIPEIIEYKQIALL